MLSTRTSRWAAATAGVSVLLAVGSWFLLVGPRLDQAARLHDEAAAARAQNDTLQLQIAQLESQYADLPKKKAELAAVNQEFPAVAEVPALLRKVNGLAGGAGVLVTSLIPGTPAYVSTSGVPGTAAGAGARDANALVAIPLTLKVTGDYFQAAQFVKQLQTQLDRAFLVTTLAVTQDDSGNGTSADTTGSAGSTGSSASSTSSATTGKIALSITGQIYALPDKAAATAATGATGTSGSTGTTSAAPAAGTTTTSGGTN
jgi:Tfp pilus assembly protein PilO